MTRATSCSSAPSSAIRSVGAVLHAAIVLVAGGIGQFLLEFAMGEAGAGCGIDAGDAAERGADTHADTCRVALAEHVARHPLAGREQVLARNVIETRRRSVIGLQAEIGEGDAGLQRVRKER